MARDAQRQRLQPLQELECVEGAQRRAEIAQQLHAHFDDEGDIARSGDVAQGVPKNEAVVARVGLGELGEFAVVPLEVAAIHDYAADGGAVPADVFRGGKHDDVRAMLDGFHEADAHGVVHHERDARLMGDGRERLEIRHVELRVADGLGVNGARLGGDRPAERLGVLGVDELRAAPEFRERVVQQRIGAAVEVVGRDDLVAGLRDGQQREADGGLARSDAERAGAAFQRRDALLKDVRRRVHQPRVDVAELLQGEEIRRMLCALEDIGSRLVNGHGAGAGGGVGNLACVEGERFKVRLGHRLEYGLGCGVAVCWVGFCFRGCF